MPKELLNSTSYCFISNLHFKRNSNILHLTSIRQSAKLLNIKINHKTAISRSTMDVCQGKLIGHELHSFHNSAAESFVTTPPENGYPFFLFWLRWVINTLTYFYINYRKKDCVTVAQHRRYNQEFIATREIFYAWEQILKH